MLNFKKTFVNYTMSGLMSFAVAGISLGQSNYSGGTSGSSNSDKSDTSGTSGTSETTTTGKCTVSGKIIEAKSKEECQKKGGTWDESTSGTSGTTSPDSSGSGTSGSGTGGSGTGGSGTGGSGTGGSGTGGSGSDTMDENDTSGGSSDSSGQ